MQLTHQPALGIIEIHAACRAAVQSHLVLYTCTGQLIGLAAVQQLGDQKQAQAPGAGWRAKWRA